MIPFFGNVIQAVYGKFSGGFSEKNRAIRIRFPKKQQELDSAILVQKISGHSTVCGGFEYELLCVATTAFIPLKQFIATPVSIELVTAIGELHVINAIITEARSGRGEGGFASYFLKCTDALELLTRRRNTRVYVNKTVLDISYILLTEWRTRSSTFASVLNVDDSGITKEYPIHSFTLQHGENDRDFLFRLWKRAGIAWRFEPLESQEGTITHKLCLFDDSTRLPQNRAGVVEFKRENATELKDTIQMMNGARTLVSGSGNVYQWQHTLGNVTNSNVYNYRTQGANADANIATLDDTILETSFQSLEPSELDRLGLLHIQRHELQAKYFEGQGSVRDFRAGTYFELTGNAELDTHQQRDRQFVITELWITAENNIPHQATEQHIKRLFQASGWTSQIAPPQAGFNDTDHTRYRNYFKAVRRDIPIVPLFNPETDLPKAHPMIATVVTPNGEEVFCDEYSRVQIRINMTKPEDHQHSAGTGANDSEGDSAWVPLLNGWSGSDFGMINLPRAGDSVVLDFLNGDIDQPFITGRLYHELRRPAKFNGSSKLPDHLALSGMKSKEIKGDAFNQLRFDDTNAQVSTQLMSSHAETQLNLGYLTHPRVKDGKGEKRGEGFELRTDEHGSIRAAKGLFIGTDEQTTAKGKQLDIEAAIKQLEQALEQAKGLQKAATQAKADPKDTYHRAASLEEQLKDNLKDLKQPSILISSVAGIATTTPKNQSYHAGLNISFTASQQIDLNAMAQFTATGMKGMSLYAYDNGIKAIASKGAVQVQAQSDILQLASQKDMTITSSQGKITIAAKNGIRIVNGDGSYIDISSSGIEIGSPSEVKIRADYSVLAGATMQAEFPVLPQLDRKNWIGLHHSDIYREAIADLGYKIYFEGNQVISGKLDAQGKAHHDNVPDQAIKVVYDDPKPLPEKPDDLFETVLSAMDKTFSGTE